MALIGSRGDAYLVAACDRVPSESFGREGWKSTRPVLLRIAKDDAVDAEIVRRRYSFMQTSEPSLAGTLLSAADVGVHPRALVWSAMFRGPGDDAATRDVCGGIDGSATSARTAFRAFAAAE